MSHWLKLLNDVIKPWDELNALLVQPLALEPELSDVTRMASSLAIAINHFPEVTSVPNDTVHRRSTEVQLMRDVADASKHGKLRNPDRNNRLSVVALFEVDENTLFRFIRNQVCIHHATKGESDFLAVSLGAILGWIPFVNAENAWHGAIQEAANQFHSEASLRFDPNYCLKMSATQYRFLKRRPGGDLVPFDPPKVCIKVF